jgi:hypothetical protein
MCFSASASFTASLVLTGAGVATVRKTTSANQLPFASVPLLFSLQQFSEGVLWMALDHPGWAFLYAPAMHLYFFIALAVWPLWIPLSVWWMETNAQARRKMRWTLDLGIILFCYYVFCHLFFGVQANGDCYHLAYLFQYPFEKIAKAAYVLAIIPTFLFSSKRHMPVLGLSAMISLLIAQIFYKEFSLSVWCFFAAVLSVQILWVVASETTPRSQTTHSGFPQGSCPDGNTGCSKRSNRRTA